MNLGFCRSIAVVALLITGLISERGAVAEELLVTNRAEFVQALDAAGPGDEIVLAPGVYAGGLFVSGLTGVTIRSSNPADPAVLKGGTNGMQLSDATNVTIDNLIIEEATSNGLNIDDGGSFDTPALNITLRNLTVRNVGAGGNQDGIKLSGVTGFHIDRVRVTNWGAGGSAIDMVGSHNGLIENSFFSHQAISTGSGVRPKGGSKNVTIRANRVELAGGQGRPIQFGGSTGAQFFRFLDGDSGYEASDIVAEGNVVVGGQAAISFVNIDGGIFHHNYSEPPVPWVLRILNENQANPNIVETRNGRFEDNIVIFGNTLRTTVNIGPGTSPETFLFARNQWFNVDNPPDSAPTLPSPEVDGTVGEAPDLNPDGVISWVFPWGLWLVNANEQPGEFMLSDPAEFTRATPGESGAFDPLQDEPLMGEWTLVPILENPVSLAPFSQVVLMARASDRQCKPVNLLPGFNLIGVPTPAFDASCFALLRAIGDGETVSAIQRFDAARGKFVVCGFEAGNDQPYGTDFPIRSGEGYIALMRQPALGVQLNDPAVCSP